MTLLTSQTSAREADADAIIIGVVQGPGGPLPAPGRRKSTRHSAAGSR